MTGIAIPSEVSDSSAPAVHPRGPVVDFDFADIPGAGVDVHLAWKRLHEGPPVFWTPRYGGHWGATRAADIERIQLDHEVYWQREFSLCGTDCNGYLPLKWNV